MLWKFMLMISINFYWSIDRAIISIKILAHFESNLVDNKTERMKKITEINHKKVS